MTGGNARRLGAVAALLAGAIALVGQAGAADPPPAISINDVSKAEGATLDFSISIPAAAANDVSVKATTSGGSGYTSRSETVTIPAGQTSVTFNVETAPNDLDEPDRQFTVTLSEEAGADNPTIADATGIGTITDDDATPTLAISPLPTVGEATGPATYSVAIAGKSAATVTVDWAAANGTASNADYGPPRSGTLSWPSGDTASKSISIPIVNDTLDEIDETFSVNLSGASGASITTATAATTITDDDPEPSVASISDVTVPEGNDGLVDASITVTLSAPSGKTVSVPYSTAPLSATEGTDYEAKSGNYVFQPGEVSQTVVFKVKGDTLFEQDEKFSIVLTDPINGGIGPDMRGEVTIDDDDSAPAPTLSSPSVTEGNAGLVDLVFEATLAAPHPAVTFNFRTVTDTATASDFDALTGSKLFPANATTTATKVPITIKVRGDLLDELDETLKLELLNNDDVVVRTASGTIKNDDNNSKLSISDASADEPGTMKFTVTLAPASGRTVTVDWATADGTATAGVDYTAGGGGLTFAPGEASKTIDVAVLGDAITEENETLKVVLSGATGVPAANVLDAQGDGTIVDKNAPPSLSISDTVAREGTGATFTVTLAGTTLREVRVGFNTADGTAKAGSDYSDRRGTLTFAPGEKSKTIVVTVLDDTATEPLEDFSVNLGDAVNAVITKSRGVASIEASDQVAAGPNPPTTTTPPPTARPATVLVPRMILGPRTVSVGANGIARMLVTCQKVSPIGCSGTVELERAVKPLLKLGKKTFTVKKGAKGYTSIKLTPRALTLLRKSGTLRAKVVVLVKTSGKSLKVSPGVITLKGTKALLTAKPKPAAPPTTKVIVDP